MTDRLAALRGQGSKKPKKQRTPREDGDNLFSNQVGRVIDLICEGPIEGWATGSPDADVYLDESKLSSYGSSAQVTLMTGEIDQDPLANYPGTEEVQTVGDEVRVGAPITAAVVESDIDLIRVQMYTPQLRYQDLKSGDVHGYHFSYQLHVRETPVGGPDGPWILALNDILGGKTRSGFGWTRNIDLNALNLSSPCEVRMTRTSPDDPSSNYASQIYFTSLTLVKNLKLAYPGSAVIALSVTADEFDQIPARAYWLKLRKVLVPTNYDPKSKTYTGPWDGTFKGPLWTDNPAWCLYDLLLDQRAGLGEWLSSGQVDKWALYEIGRYCDQMVPSGKKDVLGADIMEPRFTLNMYLQEPAEAYKVVSDITSAFRGMVYWYNGMVSFSQDRPKEKLHTFSPANVVDGLFQYSYSGRRARHTVVKVRWNDPEDFARPAIEYVEDSNGIAKYGYLVKDATAIGCTSQGQAIRLGRWLLATEQLETQTVMFRTGLEAMKLLPGNIVGVQDPAMTGKRWGGRLRQSSLDVLDLDAAVTLEDGQSYDVSVLLPDLHEVVSAPDITDSLTISRSPISLTRDQIRVWADFDNDGDFEAEVQVAQWLPGLTDTAAGTITIVPNLGGSGLARNFQVRFAQGMWRRAIQVPVGGGTVETLTVTTDLPEVPPPNSMWVLTLQNTDERLFRVMSVEERQRGVYEVVALQYDELKFAAVETGLLIEDTIPPEIDDDPRRENPPVEDIRFDLEVRSTADGTRSILHLYWDHPEPQNQRGYLTRYRTNDGPWMALPASTPTGLWTHTDAFIWDVAPGTYEVEVAAVNLYNRTSVPVKAEYELGDVYPIQAVKIVRLELSDQNGSTQFRGKDAAFQWNVAAPQFGVLVNPDAPDLGITAGVGESKVPYVKDFEVRVYEDGADLATATPLRVEFVPVSLAGKGLYTYTFDKNKGDGLVRPNGKRLPRRRFTVAVAARDVFGRTSDFVALTVENPAPAAVLTVDPLATFDAFWVRFTNATDDPDYTGVLIWASAERPDFDLVKTNEVSLVSESPAVFDAPLVDTEYWVRVAPVDEFFPIDDYTEDEVLGLLNVSTAVSDRTPFIDGAVDIKKLSIGEALIQNAAIGTAKIREAAITNALIKDLTVETLKIAGNAVSQMQERTVTPRTILDTLNIPAQKGVWQNVIDIEVTTAGGPVQVSALLFMEVVSVDPTIAGLSGIEAGQLTPIYRYRLVRNPELENAIVYKSGKLSVSISGYFIGGGINRNDQPPPGKHVYRLQVMHDEDVYEAGLATRAGTVGGGPVYRQINGIGTRWLNNVVPGYATFQWVDSSGVPEGSAIGIFSVIDDGLLQLNGGLDVLDKTNYRYRIVKTGTGVSTSMVVDILDGWVQLLELKR